MNRIRTIATGLLTLVGLASFGAAVAQTGLPANVQGTPVELQILNFDLAPVTGATVSVNGVVMDPDFVGRYSLATNERKVVLEIEFADKGVQPVLLEIPLQEGERVYLEVCVDPQTGQVKNILQKAKTRSVRKGNLVGNIGGNRSRRPGQFGVGTPVNDDCANAIPIADGVTPFSTIGATTDGPDHPGVCEFGNGETVDDIWYIYTASVTGFLTISTCGDADYDTDLVAYDGTDCGNLLATLLGCDDDTSGCAGFTSELTVPITAGNEYLIRVGGYGALGEGDEGTGNLTLTSIVVGANNDDCADAENIDCNGTATFDNTLYTSEPTDPDFTCSSGGVGSAWYTFVASDTSAFLNTNLSAGGDSVLAVYDGVCGAFTELGCDDDSGPGLLSELTVTGLTVGNTYYVQVAAWSTSSLGEFTLELVCPAPGDPTGRCCLPDGSCFDDVTEDDCFVALGGSLWLEGGTCFSNPCPVPPANDECVDAEPLAIPGTVTFDNTLATDDIVVGTECGVFSGPWKNVWYTVTGTGGTLQATTCNAGTVVSDTKIAVYCKDCLDLGCVDGNDDDCPGFGTFLSTVEWCSEPGREYFITVGNFSSFTTPGVIELNVFDLGGPCGTPTGDCAPIGACCLPDGSCVETTADDCAALGGDYLGDGVICETGSDAVTDGGFEAGAFGGTWTEFSSTFGTPLCDLGSCGTGGGAPPFEGDWWCWFGGISGIVESGSVEQTVTIPVGSDELTFYLDISASSGNASDFMNVLIDGTTIFSVLENDATYAGSAGVWMLVSLDISGFADGGSHLLRFESTTFGDLGVTNFFIDAVSIPGAPAGQCKQCVVIDFETEDDFLTVLVNGQDISTPPEFGNLFAISASTISEGPAIFDTDPMGPNSSTNNDNDLLVDIGNALIFQEVPGQTVPGIFDDPDDSSAGGTFFFDFNMPVEVRSLVLADIDLYPLPQDAYVTLVDSNFNTRTYHCPSGFTEDITIDGPTGWRKLDLTILTPQPGFVADATATEDMGFDPCDVIRMEVSLTSSGAVDDIEICF